MNKLYTTPFRVYLCLGLLALLGVWAGMDLPISLYPNSNKPTIQTGVSYGGASGDNPKDNFYSTIYGQRFLDLRKNCIGRPIIG